MRSAKAPTLVALLLASFAVNLDTTIVNVALPSLIRELHATDTQLQWVVDAYNLVFAALILTSGSLSDRLGRKGMLLGGLAVFGLGSLTGGLMTSADALIALRAVMGLGAAMVFPATLSLIANVFTERAERARAIGLWGASAGVAIAVGPIVGGWFLDHFTWSAIFFAMTPVAAVAGLLTALVVPTSRDPAVTKTDLPGFALSTAAMGALVYTLIEAPNYGWTSGRTLGGFAGAAVLLAIFVWWSRRTARPMLDLRLFRNPRFSAASGSVTLSFFTLFGFIFLMTQYFQFIKGYSPLTTGVRLLPVAVSVGVASVLGTKLAVRAGTKLVVVFGLSCVTAFYLWVAGVITPGTSYAVIALQMVVYGVGMGFTSAPATESIMGAVATERAGVGSAVNDATRLLGGTLGVAVVGSVFASLYGSRLTTTLPSVLPKAASAAAHQSVGAAFAVADKASALGHPAVAAAVHQAASTSFIHGLSIACLVAGSVAAAGAVMASVFLPSQPPSPAEAVGVRTGEPAQLELVPSQDLGAVGPG
jgi:EmrB/QacA subfamily drug resistance transporter